jgi:hypothetical protein
LSNKTHFEVGRAGKSLIALVALIWPFASVGPFVLQQLTASRKLLPAMAASVLFIKIRMGENE